MAPLGACGLWGFVTDSVERRLLCTRIKGGSRGICQVVDPVRKSRMEDYLKDGEGPQFTTSVGEQRLPGEILEVEMLQDM